MAKVRRKLATIWFISFVGLGACGCTSVSATPVGGQVFAPLPATQTIIVFSREADVQGPFEVLAIIDYNNPGKYQVLSLGDAVPTLKDEARSVGANALIIDEANPVKSGIISTGIHVLARAIRTHSFDSTVDGNLGSK